MIRSAHLFRLKKSMPRQTSSTAPSPCTCAGIDPDMQARKTARENVDMFGDGRAARRGHDADAPRKAWQRALPLRREQAFRREFSLELLEGKL